MTLTDLSRTPRVPWDTPPLAARSFTIGYH